MTKGPNPIPVRAQLPKPSMVVGRACFALAQSHVTGNAAEKFIPSDDIVARNFLTRADQTIGTTTVSGWASQLTQTVLGAFLTDLAPYSAAARLIAQATPASAPDSEFPTSYPTRTGRSSLVFVSEGAPIPVGQYAFNAVAIGPMKKLGAIVPWSRELSKRSDADRVFEAMLREDAAAGLDAALFATTAASTAAPAGLLNGVTASSGFAGGDRAAIDQDLTTLSDAVATGGSGNVTFIMAPERLARLRIKAPDLVKALDIAPSASVPTNRVIAADGAALLVAADSEPEIDVSNAATLHMSDIPLEIVSGTGPTAADPVRSLWQTATVALRLIYSIAFSKRRAGAVAYVDNVTW